MKFLHRVVATLVPVLAATTLASAPAHAIGEASLRVLSPLEPQSVVASAITVDLEMNLGGAPSGTLHTSLWDAFADRTVTAAQCPDTCTLQVVLDPASFDNALDNDAPDLPVRVELFPEGGSILTAYTGEVAWTAAAGNTTNGTLVSPVETPTRAGYASWVSDTGVAVGVRSNVSTREAGEVVEGRLYRTGLNNAPSGAPLATSTGPWDGKLEAWASFDTSALAEGQYVARLRVRSAAGGYASGGDRTILVRHHPSISFSMRPLSQLADAGAIGIVIEGPRASTTSPADQSVIEVDGTAYTVPTQGIAGPFLYSMTDPRFSAHLSVAAPRAAVGLGSHDFVVRLRTSTGAAYAPAWSGHQKVADFVSAMTVPTLFVGRIAKARLVATSPDGFPFTDCWAGVQDGERSPYFGALCTPGSTTTDRTFSWTPVRAGAITYGYALRATDTFWRDRTANAVVYRSRSAAVTAPTATYGSTGTVYVALKDLAYVGDDPVSAPSGIPVTLELRRAGSSSWVALATAKTVTGGTARLTYTSRYNGTFRVRYASTAPGLTEVSGSVVVWSKAAVVWSTAPTSTYVGRSTLFRVTAKPFQTGARAALQARPVGGAWETFASAAVTSSGWATFSARFPGRGTYEVRVVRYGTSLNATAYSSTRRVTVR